MGFSAADLVEGKAKKKSKYEGSTKFLGEDVGQEHTPTDFVNGIINANEATDFSNILVTGTMGTGKSTVCEMLAHLIHVKRPEYNVRWAGANELRRLTPFLNGLPKTPHIVIFDDVSKALESLEAGERAKVFETLTKGRHITNSKLIIFCIIHYTKALDKSMRAQNMFHIFTSTSMEENKNIEDMLGDNYYAKQSLKKFSKAFISWYKYKTFELRIGKGQFKKFVRDKPFRPVFAVDAERGKIMLAARMNCAICSQKKIQKKIAPEEIVKRMQRYEKRAGIQGLALVLNSMGYSEILPNNVKRVVNFLTKLFQEYSTDYDKLVEQVASVRRFRAKGQYTNRKKDAQFFEEFDNASYIDQKKIGMPERISEGLEVLFADNQQI